jgi:hypothetical protein
MRQVGIDEAISPNNPMEALKYEESGLSGCEFGCKVYTHRDNGDQVVAHNSAYGCNKKGKRWGHHKHFFRLIHRHHHPDGYLFKCQECYDNGLHPFKFIRMANYWRQ